MTPHEILGVPVTADLPAIKAAYRKLAFRHHPDHGGTAAEFRRIHAAYQQAVKMVRTTAAPPNGPVPWFDIDAFARYGANYYRDIYTDAAQERRAYEAFERAFRDGNHDAVPSDPVTDAQNAERDDGVDVGEVEQSPRARGNGRRW